MNKFLEEANIVLRKKIDEQNKEINIQNKIIGNLHADLYKCMSELRDANEKIEKYKANFAPKITSMYLLKIEDNNYHLIVGWNNYWNIESDDIEYNIKKEVIGQEKLKEIIRDYLDDKNEIMDWFEDDEDYNNDEVFDEYIQTEFQNTLSLIYNSTNIKFYNNCTYITIEM